MIDRKVFDGSEMFCLGIVDKSELKSWLKKMQKIADEFGLAKNWKTRCKGGTFYDVQAGFISCLRDWMGREVAKIANGRDDHTSKENRRVSSVYYNCEVGMIRISDHPLHANRDAGRRWDGWQHGPELIIEYPMIINHDRVWWLNEAELMANQKGEYDEENEDN